MQQCEFIAELAATGGVSLTGLTAGAVSGEAQLHRSHGRKYGVITASDHDRALRVTFADQTAHPRADDFDVNDGGGLVLNDGVGLLGER